MNKELLEKIKVGDYVSFFEDDSPRLLYRVLDIDKKSNHTYILYYDEGCGEELWERIEYVERVFEVKDKSE